MTRNVDQLKLDYANIEWRRKFARLCDLVEVLADCIIADDYIISDALNDAVVLSQSGVALRDRLVRRESVPAKEAKLMCFLTVGHTELYIDVDRCNLDQLASAINQEITQRRIRFPFIFGRELYDRYAEVYEDEKEALSPDETQRFLEPLPPGVFQYGPYTVGPYGLREAPTFRTLPSVRRVPAYHCARTECRTIHSVLLETSHSAVINRDREKLADILRDSPDESAEWWAFAADINGLVEASYEDKNAATLFPLIGDALNLAELRALFSHLLDNTRGTLRSAVAPVLSVAGAEDSAAALERAQLLQLLLFAHEDNLATSLDRLVRDETVAIPRGEVRRAVATHAMRSGAFRLRAELGSHGLRLTSEDPGFALLRERRLLDALYVRNVETDVAELEWQLRGLEVDDLDERLEHFFQKTDPRRVLERLVLARKTNMIAACEEVGLEDGSALADGELIETILWKLGFEISSDDDPHAEFWSRHERLWALTQSSEMGASERFLESASPYFTRLEGLLLDALAYTAWALLTDHTTADLPFSYDDDDDRHAGLALMNAIAPSPSGSADYGGDRVDLANLIGGFSALSRRLEECAAEPQQYLRPSVELPEYDGKTDIKTFLLRSTVPFVDLTPPGQARILEGLREITKVMTSAEVNLVRNEYAHYRRNAPDVTRVESALEATRQAVTRIETLGFCRLLFSPVRVTRDPWGRSTHEFRGPRSYEHAFTRPTRYDWMGLPRLDGPVYLMRSASIGEPTEVLRFNRRYKSPFSEMWSKYPARRRKPRSSAPDQSDPHGAEATTVLG